ncbi:T9SS type A sorting domain-containing protein [Vicingus serpentipes]|uniref:T9SS type A sorting domain-containing protein n=1 Tax=Vicingus serpentipes TaxID=1926625 RepID=A0A5C6RSR7_9FLAO|nr:PA domain-containing protein [Vicingus serpentipes]TXB65177.1 T9SS type A sorting domain-containing protein [Vicingus serpentipes]
MEKLFTLLISFLILNSINSQVIFQVTESPNDASLLGVYDSRWADPISSGYSATPDMTNSGNAIEAELVFAEDATTFGVLDPNANNNPSWQDACEPVINDLTGKIAVVYRSFCWHDIKAYYAQQAGAIGVIIINREPGTFGMGGTTYASSITIPVVAIGSEEGDLLKAQIAAGGVVAFIGTKIGLHPNDMGTSKSDIVMAESFSNPISLSQDSSELNLDLGLWTYNQGSNPQNGVTASVNIDFEGNTIHSFTSNPVNFTAPLGIVVDTQYIDLGNFGRTSWQSGVYTITYSIYPNIADDDSADNVVVSQFKVTNDNTYSKSRVDVLNQPIATSGKYLWEGVTSYDDFEVCIQYKNPNASRLNATGLTYSCTPVGSSMSGELLEVRLYEWNDVFSDANDPSFPAPASLWSLNQIGSATDFYIDESESGVNKYLEFTESPISLNDNQRYLFCVYTSSDSLQVGFDSKIDYYATVNNYLEYSGPVKTLATGGSSQWYAAGFGFETTPAIVAHFDFPTNITNYESDKVLIPYPNPTANLLTIPLRKKVAGKVTVEMFDLSGKLVLTENSLLNGAPLKINVSAITNGSYLIRTIFSDGTQDSYKIAVNR